MNELYLKFAKSALTDLAEYKGKTIESVTSKAKTCNKELNRIWVEGPKNHSLYYLKEIKDLYLYDLAWWHSVSNGVLKWMRVVVENIEGTKILDFGGGIGTYTCILAYLGYEVTYIDINPYNLAFTKWRLQKNGLKASFEIKGNYDSIVCMDTFEHLPDPVATLEMMYNIMNKRGVLVSTSTNEFNTSHGAKLMHTDSKEIIEAFEAKEHERFDLVAIVDVGLSTPPHVLRRKQ